MLRSLHQRINRELADRLGGTQASFDGPDYRFHATIATGGQPPGVYQKAYVEFREIDAGLSRAANQIATLYYCEGASGALDLVTFRLLPLGNLEWRATRLGEQQCLDGFHLRGFQEN